MTRLVLFALLTACGGRIDQSVDAAADAKKDAKLDDGTIDVAPPVEASATFDPVCDAPSTPSGGSCASSFQCNPVTNGQCDGGAGEACDVSGTADFQCYPPPPSNTTDLCQACDDQNTACKPGSTCLPLNGEASACAKFCCDDGDCGSGHCDKSWLQTSLVGVCVK